MKTFLKRVFCSHVWKISKQEYLRNTKLLETCGPEASMVTFKVHAVHQECIKCGKTKITEFFERVSL